jgi:glycosyltransferase involved in cell wall biosynthesis
MRGWPAAVGDAVGVALVSWNTRAITAQAIYALCRTIVAPPIRIVVVDNASTDGSVPMLRALAAAGVCEVILNAEQRYHGPALNQAIEHLAVQPDPVGLVWVLDSDCIVLRPDTLTAAVTMMRATGAGLIGQRYHHATVERDLLGLHCMLLDPVRVWRDPIAPFEEDGSPSARLQLSAAEAGIASAELPFTRDGYVVHLGRSTLRAVAERRDVGNRYHDWATTHRDPHFAEEPGAPARYAAFLERFRADVGAFTDGDLVRACTTVH